MGIDGKELGDPADDVFGDREALRSVDVHELAPDQRQAGDVADCCSLTEVLELGLAISLHPAAKADEMVPGVLACAFLGEPISSSGRCRAAQWSLVTGTDPQQGRLDYVIAGRNHLHGQVMVEGRLGQPDLRPMCAP